MKSPGSIAGYLQEELATLLANWGEPPYRAAQIQRWVFQRRAMDYGPMSDLPRALRDRLDASLPALASRVEQRRTASDGTEALLVRLGDGECIECVLIRDAVEAAEDGLGSRTVCVSTQVGCAMGCVFCASGLAGVRRDLEAGEIVEQFLHARHLLPAEESITHLVLMGMGEPLANYRQVLKALHILHAEWGAGLSARRITLSTVGVSPAAIDRLATEDLPIRLAISLHAPDDLLRRRIVATATKVTVAELLAAAERYRAATGRDVTFEYTLIGGVNDGPEPARRLAALLVGRHHTVNLIPLNPVPETGLAEPAAAAVASFRRTLAEAGVVVRVRARRGADVEAACGQLRLRSLAGGVGAECRN